jgi:AcrR family transcriptional regulator
MAQTRPNSRERILDAAVALAREVGPGNLSLDAVARRAGISKGGLLYNFPNKTALLKALVSHHIDMFEAALAAHSENRPGIPDTLIAACIDLFEEETKEPLPPATGFLAALAEDPELLEPAQQMTRRLLDRVRRNASDETTALVVFMALQGLRSLPLLGFDILTPEERSMLLAGLRKQVRPDDAS